MKLPEGMKKILKHFLRYLTALRVGENKRNSNNNLDLPCKRSYRYSTYLGLLQALFCSICETQSWGDKNKFSKSSSLRPYSPPFSLVPRGVPCDHIFARKRPLTSSIDRTILDWQKKSSTVRKILARKKFFNRQRKFSIDKKNSRSTKKFSIGKKILDRQN